MSEVMFLIVTIYNTSHIAVFTIEIENHTLKNLPPVSKEYLNQVDTLKRRILIILIFLNIKLFWYLFLAGSFFNQTKKQTIACKLGAYIVGQLKQEGKGYQL